MAIPGLLAAAPIVLLAGAFGWVAIARRRFETQLTALVSALRASQHAPLAAPELPAIVRDYAVRAGGRLGASGLFHARQTALLTTMEGTAPIALAAEQWTGIVSPGLVWRADGRMRGLPVSVFDALVEGRGELSARLLWSIPVAGGRGADYDRAEMMRFLSELPVYPDAILNNGAVRWRQLDARTVEAAASSAGGAASVRFTFDEAGDIVAMTADDRPRTIAGGASVPTGWRGTYSRYTGFGPYRLPAYGEVGWDLPGGFFTYWRGTLVGYGRSMDPARIEMAQYTGVAMRVGRSTDQPGD